MPLKKTLYNLTGSYSDFSLEHRIFHSFCIVAIITLAYCIPLNFALDLPVSAWLSFAGMLIQCLLFYLSRYRNRSRLSLILSLLIIHVILIANYYYNSGISGPSLLLLLAVFFLVAAVSKPESYKYWLSLNILIAVGLPLFEYLNPPAIEIAYVSRLSRFGDIVTTYCLCAMIILIGLHYVKRNYYRSQELLKAKAEDLERINQTKNKMFSIVSHDLRAPIASIQSYLEILTEMDIDHEDSEKVRCNLMQLTQNTDMMLSNLLMWSKSQMEGIVINNKLINLAEAITPVITVFQPIAERKGITMTYTIDPEAMLLADKNMLQLVIRNILSNAIKFTHSGNMVSLEARRHDSACEIVIKDNGVGMDDRTKAAVFSIRAESSYGTNNEKGVGLGLSLSKEFTELQNGKIRFESTPGAGTTFYIIMPLS
ncbi:MAG: sensor histidine kinase [Daejeonella sp.]|uniref:sensor histidine kinase n=1 Tax=Daejeonella sp. JGW-45 TaxID=3034148 RepID=UPI0023EDDAA4|nr:HAMP domain-containing sensor histidine kinase [Daejeonella sp. JGW-45]